MLLANGAILCSIDGNAIRTSQHSAEPTAISTSIAILRSLEQLITDDVTCQAGSERPVAVDPTLSPDRARNNMGYDASHWQPRTDGLLQPAAFGPSNDVSELPAPLIPADPADADEPTATGSVPYQEEKSEMLPSSVSDSPEQPLSQLIMRLTTSDFDAT